MTSARAGDVTQQPDPDLLKRFEAEKEAAQADQRRAEDMRQQGEEKIKRGQDMQREAAEEADRELCRQGLLPANLCP